MRSVRTITAGVCAAAVGVLGLSGMAQAQTGTTVAATPSTTVAAGVETAIKLTLPAGCTGPVTVKGFPAPNGSTTNLLQVNSGTTVAPIVKLAGEWPPPSHDPQAFTLTITCANSKTGKETVTDRKRSRPDRRRRCRLGRHRERLRSVQRRLQHLPQDQRNAAVRLGRDQPDHRCDG